MRILMVTDFYPPIIGGLERHVQTLSRELARRGHAMSVATLRHDGSPERDQDAGVRLYRVAGWSRALAPFYATPERHFHPTVPDPGVMAALRRIVRAERPDIVHARGWMLYSFLPLKEWSGARLVVTLHDYGLVCAKKTYLRAGRVCAGPSYAACVRCASAQYGPVKGLALTTGLHVSGRLHRHVDRYIAISAAVRDATRVEQQVDVVPTFIPDDVADRALAAPRPAFLPPEDDYVLFVGQLGAHKGLDVLLDAYRGLEHPAPLVVIGTGRAEASRRFPAGVMVARDVPHAQVMAAWTRCTVGVVPSLWAEPFGQVAIEAMACGKPVVASAIGGLREAVVDGETGLLVPPGDVGALRAALDALLCDPARRARLGAAGWRRSRLFTAPVVTDRIERIYEELL